MTVDIRVEAISAVTLTVADMACSLAFYSSLGFDLAYGGPGDRFSSLVVGDQHLNLIAARPPASPWGRVIFHVTDVDEAYRAAVAAGHEPEAPPRDAPWGERYFHLDDPDGHRLSFARPVS